MKKVLFTISLALMCALFSTKSNAQISIGVNGAFHMPMGDFAKEPKDGGAGMGMGFGGGLCGKYFLNESMAVGAGFDYLMGASVTSKGFKFSMIPIYATFEYYFGKEGFKPYAGLDLGLYMMTTTIPEQTITVSFGGFSSSVTTPEVSASESKIGFAPKVGFNYGLSSQLDLNFHAKYTMVMTEGSSLSMIGASIGLFYNLGNFFLQQS